MADEIDLANDLLDKEISYALGKARNKQKQGQTAQQQASNECMECGDVIPEQRRALGFNMCILCANETERRQSLYAE